MYKSVILCNIKYNKKKMVTPINSRPLTLIEHTTYFSLRVLSFIMGHMPRKITLLLGKYFGKFGNFLSKVLKNTHCNSYNGDSSTPHGKNSNHQNWHPECFPEKNLT